MAPTAEPSLHGRAEDNLRFIRDTMARAATFTAVPGWGGVLMGTSALVTAAAAHRAARPRTWLALWLGDAAVAAVIGAVAIVRKARRSGVPLDGTATRRFILAFLPALAAAAVLTAVLARDRVVAELPGAWLLLYGVALSSGGAFSVRLIPLMGWAFMLLGMLAFLSPPTWGDFFMAAGFGLLHIGFGVVIARRYGG